MGVFVAVAWAVAVAVAAGAAVGVGQKVAVGVASGGVGVGGGGGGGAMIFVDGGGTAVGVAWALVGRGEAVAVLVAVLIGLVGASAALRGPEFIPLSKSSDPAMRRTIRAVQPTTSQSRFARHSALRALRQSWTTNRRRVSIHIPVPERHATFAYTAETHHDGREPPLSIRMGRRRFRRPTV